jgi:hypothetical protein
MTDNYWFFIYLGLGNESCSVTTFCFKLGTTVTVAYEMFEAVSVNEVIPHTCVFVLFKWFREGYEDQENDPSTGQL